mgnify:FL=1
MIDCSNRGERMPKTKDFKTINEQLAILDSRHLKFKNRKKAAELLGKYNYFDLINGFESILLKKNVKNKVYEDVYFEDFKDLFFFDMKLKKYTLAKIFDIESRLRTSIAYNFAETYCQTAVDTMNYTNSSYYKAPTSNKDLINKFNNFDLFKKPYKGKYKTYIDYLKNNKDYVRQYTNPPFWVTIKSLPLGSLYYTFVFLNDVVKKKVLRDFGMELTDSLAFEQALYILKEIRNQCAHLELITRFKIKDKKPLNYFNEIKGKAALTLKNVFYIDILKIFKLFGGITDIKREIVWFYFRLSIKGRKKIAEKAISKMGSKKLYVWMRL